MKLFDELAPRIVLEASGGIPLSVLRKSLVVVWMLFPWADLTHSFQALDISLDLNAKKKGGLSL